MSALDSAESVKSPVRDGAAEDTAADVVVEVAALTDEGLVREKNEDSYAVAHLDLGVRRAADIKTHRLGPKGTLLLVCDGMGGAAAGEFASQVAVDAVVAEVEGFPASTGGEEARGRRLRTAVRVANRRIVNAARWDPRRAGMGTTLTAAWIASRPGGGASVVTAQVGDSRAYLVRRGQIGRLTRDQSLAEQLLALGHVSAEEAKIFERIGIILQALGAAEDVVPDFTWTIHEKGDVLLLCSDGLSGCVSDEEMLAIVDGANSLAVAAATLVARAREAGAPDNVTAVLARLSGAGLENGLCEASEAYAPIDLGDPSDDPLPEPPVRARQAPGRLLEAPPRFPKEPVAAPERPDANGGKRGLAALGAMALVVLGVLYAALG